MFPRAGGSGVACDVAGPIRSFSERVKVVSDFWSDSALGVACKFPLNREAKELRLTRNIA